MLMRCRIRMPLTGIYTYVSFPSLECTTLKSLSFIAMPKDSHSKMQIFLILTFWKRPGMCTHASEFRNHWKTPDITCKTFPFLCCNFKAQSVVHTVRKWNISGRSKIFATIVPLKKTLFKFAYEQKFMHCLDLMKLEFSPPYSVRVAYC